MKKIILSMILLSVILSIIINYITSEIKKERNQYELKIGEKYVLEKDTLIIIDYSSIMETFTLSNGKTINSKLILNKKPESN